MRSQSQLRNDKYIMKLKLCNIVILGMAYLSNNWSKKSDRVNRPLDLFIDLWSRLKYFEKCVKTAFYRVNTEICLAFKQKYNVLFFYYEKRSIIILADQIKQKLTDSIRCRKQSYLKQNQKRKNNKIYNNC